MSGTEMQRAKESAAEIMRAKQAAGTSNLVCVQRRDALANMPFLTNSRGQES